MIRIAWSNLRSASGRLFAATIAIAVSVAFIVAALLFSQAFGDTLRDQVRAQWAGADVVVSEAGGGTPDTDPLLTRSLAKTAAGIDGVESAQLTEVGFVSVASSGATVSAMTTNVPEVQDETIAGAAPESDSELMLHEADAKTLGLGVGDHLTMKALDGPGGSGDKDRTFTVSGIMSGSSASTMALYLTDAGLKTVPTELAADSVRVVAADGVDRSELAEEVRTAVAEGRQKDALTVRTVDQVVDEQLEAMSDSTDVLSTVGLAFGLLAAGVAALVISNTFNVLVASRTRVLALVRAVGASKRQVRGAAVAESLTLGVIGSVIGVGLGIGMGWALAAAARAFWMPEFAQMSLTPVSLVTGLAVGILVTVAAGLVPALRSSRVSPIEALRPVDVPAAAHRVRWVRMSIAIGLGAVGIALSLLGATSQSVLFGILGCFGLFVALLVGARVFVPPLVALLARVVSLITRRSPTVQLAGRSASTAGGRTASTTGALLIGITLVSAVVVGSASLQRTLELATAEDTPVDLVIDGSGHDIDSVLDDASVVEDRVEVPATTASVSVAGTDGAKELAISSAEEAGGSPVLRSDGYRVEQGEVLIAPDVLGRDDLPSDIDGKTVTVTVGGKSLRLEAVGSWDVPDGTALVSGADAKTVEQAAGDAAVEQTWVKIADDASGSQIEALTSQLEGIGADSDARPAQSRAEFASLFQVALTVVLGLLAAAVIIAVIGVSNTLTLSVIDRRREGALLRALGFTRRSMSRMITTESLLMTVIALVVGVAVGTFFGWVGTASITPDGTAPALSLPPLQLGLIGVAAILAAVLASAIPARAMSRIAPAKGMSME